VETGREIIAGQYSGISGFSHVMGKLDVSFQNKNRAEANEILELVRYANVESHKPLVEDELKFITRYPQIARKLLTMTPLA
jgi:homocitrate synthase NifV